MWYAANVISNIMDQNNDGIADNSKLASEVNNGSLYFIVGGDTAEQEAKGTELANSGSAFNGAFPLKAFHANGNLAEVKKIINEEIMHFMTQVGWGPAFPAKLGVTDFTSELCQQMSSLTCANPGWVHPDNTCTTPGT